MGFPALLFMLLLAHPQARPAEKAPPKGSGVPEYRIGPEDVLIVSVWQNADLSRTVPVRPDGRISLPLVHDVEAAGLTPMELRQSLIEKLRDYIPTPEISVLLSEMNSFKVSVIGEVKRPERYRLRGPATVLDVLAMAGGFQDWANREHIIVMRQRSPFSPKKREGAEVERIPFDYKKVTSAGGEKGNFVVQPDDIIVVP